MRERWSRAWELAAAGDIEEFKEEEPMLSYRYYSTFRQIQKDFMKPGENLIGSSCGVWYWGQAGAGKSWKAREDYPDAYFKMKNKWWCGYQGQEFVIIDDIDPNHAVLGSHIKLWADIYPFLAEIKGGAITIRPKVICITSQYPPERIWPNDPETLEAIRRRFHVTQFHGKYGQNPLL